MTFPVPPSGAPGVLRGDPCREGRSQPPGRLARLDGRALAAPLSALGLCTRAFRCLRRYETLGALLAAREEELMARRNFGRACLADVRRRVAAFALAALGVPEESPMRRACLAPGELCLPGGGAESIWHAPPQPRTVAEVVEEILELLARGEMTGSARRATSARSARDARQPELCPETATLDELAAFVFAALKPREREIVELRFSAPEETAPSLADLGRRFRITRERVRQVVAGALRRLREDSERQRRHALARWLGSRFEEAGGLLREGALEALLRRRRGTPTLAWPLARILLETTAGCRRVRGDVWCWGVPVDEAAAALDALEALFRRAQSPMTLRQTAAACARHPLVLLRTERSLCGCLAAHPRLVELEGGRYGLREWEWGVPETLAGCLAACIRARQRPQSIVRVVEHVNTVLPPGREVSAQEVAQILGTEPQFVRVRTGIYGLAEWSRKSPAG